MVRGPVRAPNNSGSDLFPYRNALAGIVDLLRKVLDLLSADVGNSYAQLGRAGANLINRKCPVDY
jgi:hypothetical protein